VVTPDNMSLVILFPVKPAVRGLPSISRSGTGFKTAEYENNMPMINPSRIGKPNLGDFAMSLSSD